MNACKSKLLRIKGSITAPCGFRASGIHGGIKKKNKDFALIVSDVPAAIAGVFTTNRVQAAPVQLCRKHLTDRTAQAIIINSGNANACTGNQGTVDADKMAGLTARHLHVDKRTVFVCSTGTIGKPMPMDIVEKSIPRAVKSLSKTGGSDAASAIMTTDTCPKQVACRLKIDGKQVTIAGIAKGSGMINPNMATLLVFLTTDASVKARCLQTCLSRAVEQSFNRITIDGDQSTNDTVLFMANGMSGNNTLGFQSRDWKIFCAAVNEITMQLALMIVRDGEGATRMVTVTVKGAPKNSAAEKMARSVANSLLVKTSWFGADPNVGRIICAVGYSGVKIQPDVIDIKYNETKAVIRGQPDRSLMAAVRKIISRPEFTICIDLHIGKSSYTVYTCDCSYDYVRINASYMT